MSNTNISLTRELKITLLKALQCGYIDNEAARELKNILCPSDGLFPDKPMTRQEYEDWLKQMTE